MLKFRNLRDDEYDLNASHHKGVVSICKTKKDELRKAGVRFISNNNSHFPYNKSIYVECFGVYVSENADIITGIRAKGSSDFLFLVNDIEAFEGFIEGGKK